MSCPWAKIQAPEPVNLLDIMSEELAKDLQAKEEKINETLSDDIISEAAATEIDLSAFVDDNCESDALIAQMLQMQFDKEHDENLKRTENAYNKSSKVSISFDNYRRATQNIDFESDSEEEEIEDIRDRKVWDKYETLEKEIASIPSCGYKIQNDGTMLTKHDVHLSGRKNVCKMLSSFPPEFQTGDSEDFDMKISNKVFNKLKIHSRNEVNKKNKEKKEDQATAVFGLDQITTGIIYKLINSLEVIECVNGVVSIGKEAVIIHATTNPDAVVEQNLSKECVLKIFKTTLSEYKQRGQFIKDDYRFKERVGKQNAHKTVHLWAEKEMRNLVRLRKAKIPCPDVVYLKKHLLVLSFIGKNHVPAPKLKEANLDLAEYILAYDQVINGMKSLYEDANLIHADLSEYNILWHNDHCYFIDVSQSIEPTHENAFHFLMRDCNNITTFFTKKKVPQVESAEELFKSITGCDYDDKVALENLKESLKLKPHNIGLIESRYDFDRAWNEAELNNKHVEATPA